MMNRSLRVGRLLSPNITKTTTELTLCPLNSRRGFTNSTPFSSSSLQHGFAMVTSEVLQSLRRRSTIETIRRSSSTEFRRQQSNLATAGQGVNCLENDEKLFHTKANGVLEDVQTELQNTLEPVLEVFDLDYSDGVLTMKLGALGTYVINKQTPNRQIWWSSPISGPKRFYFDGKLLRWVSTRDPTLCLLTLLSEELSSLTKVPLDLTSLIETHATLSPST